VGDVAVRVGHDLTESRIRVHTDQASDVDDEPSLFFDFASERVGDGLAVFDGTTREAPVPVVRAFLEQQAPLVVADDTTDAWTDDAMLAHVRGRESRSARAAINA
jgi:hypothetical protein